MTLRTRAEQAKAKPILDDSLPHPYREILAELKAIRSDLDQLSLVRPGAAPTMRIPGVAPTPSPSAYVDVVGKGMETFGALRLADDYIVKTIDLGTAHSVPLEIPDLTGIALTIFTLTGTIDLYINKKDDPHKMTFTALTYPQTFLIDWVNIKDVWVGNTAQAGLTCVLIAWKPPGAMAAIPPTPGLLLITPADREAFHKLGDVNRDGVIDQADIDLIRAAWQSTPSSPNWNPDADLNGDGIVNILDVTPASVHYGLTIEQWKAGKK